MAIQSVTKPMALDETLQSTNTALGGVAKDTTLQSTNGKMDSVITKLQGIIDALGVDTSVYKAAGNKTCAELVPALLVASNLGNVYNITDSGTTTSDFVDGSGKPIHVGDNVAIVDVGTGGSNVYKFDLLAGMVDLSNYIQKSSTSGFVKNDGTIDTTTYQPTEAGKGLSSNDYTTAEKTKLAGIATGATKTESSTTNGNIKIDGTETQVYDDSEIQGKLTTDTAQATGNPINFTTKSAQNAESTIIDLEPIQDLHGYNKPWVGGAGKNLLNPTGTGEVHDGITYVKSSDGKFTASGANNKTSSATAKLAGEFSIKNGVSYTLSGCPSGGTIDSYRLDIRTNSTTLYNDGYYDYGSGITFTATEDATLYIYIRFTSSYVISGNLQFAPMIRANGDSTFEPYENICPISGRSEIGIEGCGKNLIFDKIASANINSVGVIGALSGFDLYVARVSKNQTYTITTDDDYKLYAFYTSTPTIGDASYNNSRVLEQITTGVYSFTSPISGYIAFRSETGFEQAQLEYGSQNTTYLPYKSSTDLTISFGETVYGGTLDVEKGILVVDKVLEEYDGSNDENWVRWENKQYSFRNNTLQDHIQPPDNNTIVAGTKTNELTPDTPGHVFSQTNNYTFSLDQSATRISVCIDSTIDSVTKLRNWLSSNPLQLCYPLATPTVIQLTPHQISLLKGVNNISVSDDYSTITLTYRSGEVATLGDLLEVEKKIPSATAQHNYSTEEQVVGTWIDGSPIYEKTYIFSSAITLASNTFTELVDTDNTGMETGISAKAINDIGVCYGFVAVIVNDSSGHLMVLQTRNSNITMKYLILQYTKST